jgi:hypothetical protein
MIVDSLEHGEVVGLLVVRFPLIWLLKPACWCTLSDEVVKKFN